MYKTSASKGRDCDQGIAGTEGESKRHGLRSTIGLQTGALAGGENKKTGISYLEPISKSGERKTVGQVCDLPSFDGRSQTCPTAS